MKYDNQLRHAVKILDIYQGDMPLHTWLKDYFRLNKQMGSRDRKLLSALVYGFYRLGHAARGLSAEERCLAGLFFAGDQPNELLAYFNAEYNTRVGLSLDEKVAFFQTQPSGADFRVTDVFPWKDQLSADIDHASFCLSFLRQPDLFLRIRPGHERQVRERLNQAAFIPPFTLRLPNGTRIDDVLTPDREVVVQDYSSQRIAEFLQLSSAPQFFWDACAASGGKSILTYDLYPHLDITVSDLRQTILVNLRRRFSEAGIKKYRAFVVDLVRDYPPDAAANADLILADVPCTGSGTWGRTPEDLWFFDPAKIGQYADRQQRIVAHIAPRMAPGACLVYSTCSVFKKENEDMAAFIRDNFGLRQDKMENLKGYDLRGDTLFAARYVRD